MYSHIHAQRGKFLSSFPPSSTPAALRPLLEEGFEAKAFATATIQNQMVGETLQKLANGIAALDKELYSQVGSLCMRYISRDLMVYTLLAYSVVTYICVEMAV